MFIKIFLRSEISESHVETSISFETRAQLTHIEVNDFQRASISARYRAVIYKMIPYKVIKRSGRDFLEERFFASK